MKTQLSQEQINSYRENGFIMIENFLDQSELEEWRGAVDEAVAKRKGKLPYERTITSDDFYDNVFMQRLNLWMDNSQMKKIMFDEQLGKMVCELEGMEGVRIWHDQALIKESWGNPTGFHIDNPYWSFHSKQACSIWVALDDVTTENGCLYFIPGSHIHGRFQDINIGPNLGDAFKFFPEFKNTKPVAAVMKAGSCTFHNGLTIHGANGNMTTGRRRAMTCAYMPEGSVFNGLQNVLPNAMFNTLKPGDVLNDDSFNPLIYSTKTVHANAV